MIEIITKTDICIVPVDFRRLKSDQKEYGYAIVKFKNFGTCDIEYIIDSKGKKLKKEPFTYNLLDNSGFTYAGYFFH